MATISAKDTTKIFQIQKFLGLNESRDGDTQLKYGEASDLKNFRITPQYHLKVRPGIRTKKAFSGAVRGLWCGYVAGKKHILCAADGGVWDLTEEPRRIGDIWDDQTTFFGFDNKVYILNGHEYLFWDGDGFVDVVEGYVPCILTAAAPGGGGTTLENVNRLTGKRRVQFSADGTSTEYHLPEQNLLSIDRVTVVGGSAAYSVSLSAGTVTFSEAPQLGNNNVEITYTVTNLLRSQVESMRYCESFNGYTDTRVFLYGDGSAKTIYCGVTEAGTPSADYFPDLYEIQIGNSNTPITGMVKQYDRLLSFKPDGAWSTGYSSVTLEDGTVTAGFYTNPLNREIGNEALGQVQLVYNYPRTIHAGNVYEWRTSSATVRDERNAKFISERVQNSMQDVDIGKVFTFDDDSKQEYYIFLNDNAGTVLVNGYITDTWYKYENLPVVAAARDGNDIYFGLSNGKVALFSEEVHSDDGEAIDAEFYSGSMDFGADYQKKHSSVVWVSVKPAQNARVEISARSDRKSGYAAKTIYSNVTGFVNVNFGSFTFRTSREPLMTKIKMKIKKFVYYKLIVKASSVANDTTVLGADIRVRYTGYVK